MADTVLEIHGVADAGVPMASHIRPVDFTVADAPGRVRVTVDGHTILLTPAQALTVGSQLMASAVRVDKTSRAAKAPADVTR